MSSCINLHPVTPRSCDKIFVRLYHSHQHAQNTLRQK